MNCDEIRHWLAAHLDGELDPAQSADVAGHLKTCAACAEEFRRQSAMRGLVREKLPAFAPPPHLATRIGAQLRAKKAGAAPWRFWRPAGILAGTLAALALAFFSGYKRGGQHILAVQFCDEVVSDHVQALTANHLTEVASSDRQIVKPWLAGRLDFSPPVADLAADGYPLLGARLDHFGGRTAAALIYRHNQHFLTLLVWPAQAAPPVEEGERRGYTICAWRQAGMNFAAVSDITDEEMDDFIARVKVASD